LPLESLRAIELPFSVQRRVAVSATVHDDARRFRFRATTVHLDTRAPLHRGFIFGAASARNRQAQWLLNAFSKSAEDDVSLFIGGDLNSYLGPLESSIDTLAKAAPRVDCGAGATHATGMKLVHIFARISAPLDAAACRRLSTRFESDHFPLVL